MCPEGRFWPALLLFSALGSSLRGHDLSQYSLIHMRRLESYMPSQGTEDVFVKCAEYWETRALHWSKCFIISWRNSSRCVVLMCSILLITTDDNFTFMHLYLFTKLVLVFLFFLNRCESVLLMNRCLVSSVCSRVRVSSDLLYLFTVVLLSGFDLCGFKGETLHVCFDHGSPRSSFTGKFCSCTFVLLLGWRLKCVNLV